jgi:hypothetical protein
LRRRRGPAGAARWPAGRLGQRGAGRGGTAAAVDGAGAAADGAGGRDWADSSRRRRGLGRREVGSTVAVAVGARGDDGSGRRRRRGLKT